jgi:hypothetical protein
VGVFVALARMVELASLGASYGLLSSEASIGRADTNGKPPEIAPVDTSRFRGDT